MYRPSMSFVDRSNSYKDRKICANHLLSVWGKDKSGNWFPRCGVGNRLNEDCKELVDEAPIVSER